jgi:hypothetical protein
MATTYAGVTFEEFWSGDLVPDWNRERRIVRLSPVNGSFDYKIDTGSGDYTLAVTASRLTEADVDTLTAAVSVTPRELVRDGVTFPAACLDQATGKRRHPILDFWQLDLQFSRES